MRPRVRRLAGLAVLIASTALVPACAAGQVDGPTTLHVASGTGQAVALLAEPDGSVLFAERLTGDVRRLLADGSVAPGVVAHVDVVGTRSDQRGLLGLTRGADGSLYAAWVRPVDRRLVVGRLDGPTPTLVWRGPVTSDLANGGHLAAAPDGRLVIGVGDLQQDRALAADPTVPNRKLLALEPDGAPDQRPEVLSSGWNNPFAFTFTPGGRLWVADNTPGDEPERIGRGDRPASEATDLPTAALGEAAPSALVALGDGLLGRCGYLSGRLDEVAVSGDAAHLTGRVLGAPCATGAARRPDGRLVLAAADELVVVDPG